MVLYILIFIYHVSAGTMYYRYISAKEIQSHEKQKDLKRVVRFFRFYREVIILAWFGFFLYGLFVTIFHTFQHKPVMHKH